MDYGPCQVFAGQPAVSPGRHSRLAPCREPQPLVRSSPQPLAWIGSSGSYVARAQRLLGVADDSVFGASTRRAALSYQRLHDLPRTGALDQPTWAGSPVVHVHDAGATVFALQSALAIPPRQRTGFYGPETRTAVVDVKSSHDLATTAVVTAKVWAYLPST